MKFREWEGMEILFPKDPDFVRYRRLLDYWTACCFCWV